MAAALIRLTLLHIMAEKLDKLDIRKFCTISRNVTR